MRGAAATQLRRVLADPTLRRRRPVARRRRRRGCRRRLSARPRPRPSGRWSGARWPRCCSDRRAGSRSETRSKRVLLVTLTRIVPRSESRSWNVRAVAVDGHDRALVLAGGGAGGGRGGDERGGGDQGGGEELSHGVQIGARYGKRLPTEGQGSIKGCQPGSVDEKVRIMDGGQGVGRVSAAARRLSAPRSLKAISVGVAGVTLKWTAPKGAKPAHYRRPARREEPRQDHA